MVTSTAVYTNISIKSITAFTEVPNLLLYGLHLKKEDLKAYALCSLNPLWAGEYTQTEGKFYFLVTQRRSSDSLLRLGLR